MRKRIALLFSGLPRQWRHCARSHSALFRRNDVDTFFHFWDTVDEGEKRQIVAAYRPRAYLFEPSLDFSFAESCYKNVDRINAPSRMLSMYYSWKQVATLFQAYKNASGINYDFAVRLRADLRFFSSLDVFLPALRSNDLLLSNYNDFQIINDMFALGGIGPIMHYHSLYDYIPKYQSKVPFNPEQMLRLHLSKTSQPMRLLTTRLVMLVFRPHMVGVPVEECLKQDPGENKWLDPEIVADHASSHTRRIGQRGQQHVASFKEHQLEKLHERGRSQQKS